MFSRNEITESLMEHYSRDMTKSFRRHIAGAVTEMIALLLIGCWQIWYIKNILESKNIV